jgi:hypothetical protein
MAKQTLQSWIEEVARDDKDGRPISGLALEHVGPGNFRTGIHGVTFGSKAWTSDELATLFRHKADSYAQELEGTQQFILLAFYGQKEAEASHPFKVDGEVFRDGLGTEEAGPKGVIQQSMRHLEAMMKATFQKDATLFSEMTAVIRDLGLRYRETATEANDAIRLVHELMREKITAEANQEMKRLEFERASSERKQWIGMVPPAINQLTGREVFPQSFADSKLLDTIGDSLDEEQIEKLMMILKPEQAAVLATRFADKLKKAREEREAKEREASNGGKH